MNKKLFLGMFAAATMLFATSCQNDELDAVQSGNEATVSFTLGVEGGVQTRVISDGLGAKKLVYAVYDANGTLLNVTGSNNGQFVDEGAFKNGLTHDVTITLAKGQTYTIAFWAQNGACTAYNTDDLKAVSITYPNGSLNNEETRDAFFAAKEITVKGHEEIDVTLKRPFAQINVGVTDNDWNAAVASGIEIETSKVVIKKAATSINLLDGTVSGETDVTYNLNTIPHKFETSEILNVDMDGDGTKEAYKYLSMSYILVNDATTGAAKATLEDLDLTFRPKSGLDISISEGLQNVPVQRNWRTNIIGQLLTGNITFKIKIDPAYDGDHNYNPEATPEGNNTYEINSAAAMLEIASIIAKTVHGEGNPLTFKLASDIDMTGIDWTPLAGSWVVFDGQGHTISNLTCGTDDNGRSGFFGVAGGATLKNVIFENVTAAGEQAGIISGHVEGASVENVIIIGENYVSYKDVAGIDETWGGVGAIFGVNVASEATTFGVTIDEGAVVYVEKTGLTTTQASTGNEYAMLAGATVVNNGSVKIVETIVPGLLYSSESKTYDVSSAGGLRKLSELTIKPNESILLTDDIDLSGDEFAGLSAFNAEGANTFDGQGHTISNVSNTSGGIQMGFIKSWVGTIKNVTIKDANFETKGRSAILVASVYGNIDNCHIVGGSINDTYWACGAIAGLYNSGNITNCTVTDAKVTSKGGTGGIVGVINEKTGERRVENCSVVNSKISNLGTFGAGYPGAAIAGMININNSVVIFNGNKIENCDIDNVYGLAEDGTIVVLDGNATGYASTSGGLQTIVNKYDYSKLNVLLTAAIKGDVNIFQKKGVSLSVDGQDNKYDGKIIIKHGDNNSPEVGPMIIQNINFETSTLSGDFISTNDGSNYVTNLSVLDCSFKGTESVVAIRSRQEVNLTIKDCKAEGLHSFIQSTSDQGLTIEDVTANCSEGGVNLLTSSKNMSIKNCEFTVCKEYGYGIRADGNSTGNSVTITDCKFNAYAPLLIRKATGEFDVTLTGTNTFTATNGEGYQIVATGGKWDETNALTPSTGKVNITGAEGMKIYR